MVEKKSSNGPETTLKKLKRIWGKFWHFFWEEDSLLSWIVNIIVAFLLIKGVIYPGLGLILQTSHPVVAVISQSMEHDGSFDDWWLSQQSWYEEKGITKEAFMEYDFKNGFNRGDIMLLKGLKKNEAKVGDIIVYNSYIRKEPIIHRIVKAERGGGYEYYSTKGDHNKESYPFEYKISQDKIIGRAFFKIPYLGWVKITFVCGVDSALGKDRFIRCMRGA